MNNIDSQKILYPKGKNDECMTLDYGVKPIIKYIPLGATIWCPFDKNDSQFVIQLKKAGFNVINTHIDYSQDFFTYEPEKWDVIVSNPPFTDKRKIFERALSFNKPFALIAPMTWLNDAAPAHLFMFKDLQILSFDKRMKFLNNGVVEKKITFMSAFWCYKLLPKQIIFEELQINEPQTTQKEQTK